MTFQSLIHPERLSMYTSLAPTLEDSYREGMTKLIKEQGDLMWRPVMQISMDLDDSALHDVVPLKIESNVESCPIKENSSWIMKTIIDNKDDSLYSASKKYLNKSECLFIEEKIYAKK